MAEWRMTKWQRGILISMYLLGCTTAAGHDIWITRRALESLMWFDWQGTHTQKMAELIELRWIDDTRTPDGVIAYRLTEAAASQLRGDATRAMDGIRLGGPAAF